MNATHVGLDTARTFSVRSLNCGHTGAATQEPYVDLRA